jgi:Alpha/beta hydrolase domain
MSRFRIGALCAALCLPAAAHSQVLRFEALSSTPAFEGRSFGSVGPYLKITARATIAVDPADARNAVIADTGWNPRAPGYGAGTLFPLQGAVLPFAATRAQRDAAADPRPSLAERYADNAAYIAAVRAAAAEMVAERLLLPHDAEHAIEAAAQDRLAQLR